MTDLWSDLLQGHCRSNGAYASHKLTFFDRYFPPAFRATRKKVTRHYIDLFAGPGIWQEPSGQRHLGSPLQALTLSAQVPVGDGFTEVFLVNKDPTDHQALSNRIDMLVDRGLTNLCREQIHVLQGDANVLLPGILRSIHRKSWIFTYADIERPSHWPWSTVEALRAQGHKSVDLYVLFPLHMAIRRILGFSISHPDAASRFYGCDDWQEIVARRRTSAHSKYFLREMELLYARRLGSLGWDHVKRQRRISDVGARTLYYMLFAASHPAGAGLSEWESVTDGDERFRDQGELFS